MTEPKQEIPSLPAPYLVFLGDAHDLTFAKTAFGLRDWARERCVGEYACAGGTITADLPVLSPLEAKRRGAQAVVIGVANIGGIIRDSWVAPLVEALEAGLHIVSGMHERLRDTPELVRVAKLNGCKLIDVRTPPADIPIATGRPRFGKRLLTVGTDCAVGKKYTALALMRDFKRAGVDVDFRATGQTGIIIGGGGIPIDAVVSDFVAGAAEMLSPDAPWEHWDVIEGQGSVLHPSYAGVSLGLLHGSQPDVIVLCHTLGRERLLGLESYTTPSISEAMELTLTLARRINPRARCAGVSLNTASVDAAESREFLAEYSANLGLPVADPLRGGSEWDRLVEACLA